MPTNNKSRVARNKQKAPRKKGFLKKILLVFISLFILIGLAVGVVFAYYIATAPKLDIDKLDVPFASTLYDMDDKSFANLYEENRTKIKYEDLPDVLIDAVTSTEDARFFKHPGIDIRRIGGAVIANFRHGFGSEGASTITQQVVEHMFLSPEKKIKLKVQEQWLALQLERQFSKEEILEMYLNKIFYGGNVYGVAKAAENYFGITDLNDLTLVQAAMLAGLPQRPSAYNPFENPDLMEQRVDTVLQLMVRHNKITEQEAEEARQVSIESQLTDKKPASYAYEAFVQKVKQEIEEKLDGANINTDGLKIYTTLDPSIQDYVEFLLTDSDENPIDFGEEDDLQAGMTVQDTSTGAIRAIGGSRNRENVDGTNYAIDLERQPGSAIKPIVAYGPAVEYEKWSTYHQILDEEFAPEGSNPIRNVNRKYHGWVSMREALTHSHNVPAAKTLQEIGSERAKEFAENLGIEFADEVLDPRDAIGGTSTGISPLQLAGALSAFGNEGIYTTPYVVRKVEFPDGTTLDLKPESEAVMSDYTAYMITDMLKSVMQKGTGTLANIPNLSVAGKTGTTNMEGGGANNSWFGGYTTNYSIGIWTGYKENNREIKNTTVARQLFKHTMTEISKDIETANFVKPSSVISVEVEKDTNPPQLPSEHTPKDNIVTELFVKGTEPTETSEKFDEVAAITNLRARYEEENQEIEISWEYEEIEEITFEVNYKIDDGDYKKLTETEDLNVTLDQVEYDTSYTFQVIAIDKETDRKSEPITTSLKTPEENIDDDVTELPPVTNLSATVNENQFVIDVKWNYDGPPSVFEVEFDGEKRIFQSTSIQIGTLTPHTTYTITVTPINSELSIRGKPESVTVNVGEAPNNDGDNGNNNEG